MDTSGLLKFYVEEEGSDLARDLVASADTLAMSRVGYAEARAGLAKASRTGRLPEASYRIARRAFEERWSVISVVEVSDLIVRQAGDLAERYSLRGFDSIHLSSGLLFQRESGEAVTFSAWDERLLDAAEAEGLTAAPNA